MSLRGGNCNRKTAVCGNAVFFDKFRCKSRQLRDGNVCGKHTFSGIRNGIVLKTAVNRNKTEGGETRQKRTEQLIGVLPAFAYHIARMAAKQSGKRNLHTRSVVCFV